MVLGYLRSSVQMINWAMTAWGAAIERAKPDLERESGFMDRNWARTKQRVALTQRSYDEEIDKAVLKELIKRALGLSPPLGIPGLEAPTGGNVPEAEIEAYVGRAYASSRLQDEKVMAELIEKADQANGAELMKTEAAKDPFLSFAASLYPHVQELREVQRAREGALGPLYARLSEIKEAWIGTSFIPDANSTLRLTYGRIKGYSPADAVIYRPFTTLGGVVEKTTGAQPFNTPPRVVDLWKAKDFGRFAHPGLKDVPACMLYDADTTGGNSGSPVLNARGELVGINFDRTFEATINDFAWNEEYSRSIAVDIRYVLWVAQKFGGATDLLAEIGIN
jgi:hypothetical protein